MYIILLSILITIIGIVSLCLENRMKKMAYECICGIGGALFITVGISTLLVCSIISCGEHSDRAYYNVYEKHQQYDYVYQFVIGNVEDVPGGNVVSVNLVDIAQYNAEVIRKKSARESRWINWLVCPAYDVINPFDLNLVLCGCVPDDTIEDDMYEEYEVDEE